MQFVQHHAPQSRKNSRASAVRQQQRELLRGGEQDVRRALDLPRALVGRRVAGAGLDPDRQPISRTGVSRLRAMSTASAFRGEI